jgi:glycosyltransferase involved in cell wall biosynthesis
VPKVSVITPVYNCEAFIKESLDSILHQTFQDFELIVINDGSVDKTHDVISSISDPRLRYINHEENRGVMKRSKEAIELAVGKYIAVHDGDDISMSIRLEQETKYLDENPEIFCVGGRAKKIDMNGKFIGDWDFPPPLHEDALKMLTVQRKCPVINPTSMYRLSGYNEIGGYSTKAIYDGAHDFEFWCRAMLAGKKFHNIQDYLIKYRVNTEGMTRRQKLKQFAAYNTIMLEFLQRIKQNVQLHRS